MLRKQRQASDGRFQAQSVILQRRKRTSGDGDIYAATKDNMEPAAIDDDGVEIPPPNHNEVRAALQRLKNNKGAGPTASLLNCLRPKVMSW